MRVGSEILVQSCKQDGRVRRSWPARVERASGTLFVLEGVFEEEVRHPLIGTIEAGTVSTEFFWTDRWYSVFRFQTPAGRLFKFYCNLNTPPKLNEGALTFIDLDVDVLVEPDYSYTVLDVEEFERHAELYRYPQLYRTRVREALAELFLMIEAREFPFSLNRNFTDDVTREP